MPASTNHETPVREKLERAARWLAEKKGGDILALDLSASNTFTEGIILATARSIRHAQGLADHILLETKAANFELLRMEGYQTGQWILLDLNDIVISIFQENARKLYRIEDLWKFAPVVMDMRSHAPAI